MGNLLSCFWSWISGEDNSSDSYTLGKNERKYQISNGVLDGQDFDEIKSK